MAMQTKQSNPQGKNLVGVCSEENQEFTQMDPFQLSF